jgi:hypothetical protein
MEQIRNKRSARERISLGGICQEPSILRTMGSQVYAAIMEHVDVTDG